MTGKVLSDTGIHELNDAMAQNYDAVVYDHDYAELIDLAPVCGLASLFGHVTRPVDVLDLGCGTGAQLAHAASQVSGRVVGTDISAEACRIAKQRLAPFGDRARIVHGDLLGITPSDLGQFDFIYSIGVIYIAPPEVQRRSLEIVGKCLRPGGVAVLSYYAGSVAAIRANLHQTLRAICDGLKPAQAVAHARKQLAELALSCEQKPGVELLTAAIAQTAELPDVFFFHEVLNSTFAASQTSHLERTLARDGIEFASYLRQPQLSGDSMPSRQRAINADTTDLDRGGYHFAVFSKFDGPCADSFAARPDLWQGRLKRSNNGDAAGPQEYHVPGEERKATIRHPASIAMFDCLINGPQPWAELKEMVSAKLSATGVELDGAALQTMEGDLRTLWHHGLVMPMHDMTMEGRL